MRESPFVGRGAELARLREELAATRDGARLLFVTGEAGVGKSRALAEFQIQARPRARFLVGRGSPLGTGIPFSVIVEALESHLRGLDADAVRALCPARIAMLREILPSVAAAITEGPSAPSRLATFEALLCVMTAIAADRPLVLVIDDAHRADPSTWELLGYVARNPPRAPLLIVATLRDGGIDADDAIAATLRVLLKDGLAAELHVGPLAKDDVSALVTRSLGVDATPGTAGWLYERTRGNALFTTAIIEQLHDDPTRRQVPQSVRAHVESLTAGLSDEGRELLSVAAALGGAFSVRSIAGLVPGAGRKLDELARRGLVSERGTEGEARYDFGHPLVQEVTYDALGSARRRELHEWLSRALAGETLAVRAYHAARGALPNDAAALAIIWDAAREAERAQTHREALEHLSALRRLIPTDAPERATALDEIGWQAAEAGAFAIGIEAINELLERTDEASAKAVLHMRLASLLSAGPGDLAAAEVQAREAVRLFGVAGAEDRLASATNELAWIRGEAGDLQAQIDGSRDALARAEALGDETLTLHALGSLGFAYMGERPELAVETLRRSVSLAVARRDQVQIGWHTGGLALALLCAGRTEEATRVLDALLDHGSSPSAIPYVIRVFLNWFVGRWDQALADHRVVQALHPGEIPVYAAWSATIAGLIEIARRDDVAGERHLEQGTRAYARSDFYFQGVLHDWALGSARALLGDHAAARERLDRASARAVSMNAPAIECFVLPDLVVSLVAVGDIGTARGAAARARKIATTLSTALSAASASYAEGLVAHAERRSSAARASLREAADVWATLGLRTLEARALEALARAHEGADAIRIATDAARIYSSIGAVRQEERIRAELRGRGTAGRRSAQAVGELTPREREVVTLVREGLSNREIGERLHVSERTIETHLAHIYGKLGVDNRRDLARR